MHRSLNAASPGEAGLFALTTACAGVLAATSGCVAPMAAAISAAPNFANPLAGHVSPLPSTQAILGIDDHFFVDVGPEPARLAVYVMEPDRPPRGTVLVLHGVRASSFWMNSQARGLADAGFRAVLVDLRGHGRSSGKYLTYGPHEAADLSQVIDALHARGKIAGELGVYGISYGATTALHLAGRDARVAAVAAIAPFDSMRDEVPHYWRAFTGGTALGISDDAIQQAIDRAGEVGRFNPDAAVASAAIATARAKILIMHGADDWLVPPGNGEAIGRAAGANCEFVSLPAHGHTSVWYDGDGEIARRASDWFGRKLCDSSRSGQAAFD